MRDHDALARALELTRETLGPVNHLVCGAAGNFPCPAETLSAGGFKAVVDIDLLGSFNASRAAFEQLVTNAGLSFPAAKMEFASNEAIKQGVEAAEERARTDLGLIGPRETFYQVVPDAAGGG